MTIQQALAWATKKLKQKNIDSASLDAEIILANGIKRDKTFLYTYPETKLTPWQQITFLYNIIKRSRYYPVAYLTGYKEFYGYSFYVNRHVLTPRPASELLIDAAQDIIAQHTIKTVADLGTGSGILAITIKKLNPNITVYATDISKPALRVAERNAKLHQTKIIFRHGNLLEPLQKVRIDLLIANLPYLDKTVHRNNNSLKKEPKNALFAKNKGIDYYIHTLKSLESLGQYPTYLLWEIDPHQYEFLEPYFNNTPYSITLFKNHILIAKEGKQCFTKKDRP